LGFLVDFFSHAASIGFMAGSAIIIGLQQLKGLLGITHFTHKTDIISVMKSVCRGLAHHQVHYILELDFFFFFLLTRVSSLIRPLSFLCLQWHVNNLILGCSCLTFILITRFLVIKHYCQKLDGSLSIQIDCLLIIELIA